MQEIKDAAVQRYLEKVFRRCMEEPTRCFDVDCPFSSDMTCKILEYAAELDRSTEV